MAWAVVESSAHPSETIEGIERTSETRGPTGGGGQNGKEEEEEEERGVDGGD